MSINEQPKLKFHAYHVSEVLFKAEKVLDDKIEIRHFIKPYFYMIPDKQNLFQIHLQTGVTTNGYFELQFIIVGTFELSKELDDETRKIFININAPAILFPYLRAFVSNLTANVGEIIDPIIIPVHFFQGEIEELKIADTEASTQSTKA